jgi:hypothetical protein
MTVTLDQATSDPCLKEERNILICADVGVIREIFRNSNNNHRFLGDITSTY